VALLLLVLIVLQTLYQVHLRAQLAQQRDALQRCARVGTNVNRVPTSVAPSVKWYLRESASTSGRCPQVLHMLVCVPFSAGVLHHLICVLRPRGSLQTV
jgi:hypothetical protein